MRERRWCRKAEEPQYLLQYAVGLEAQTTAAQHEHLSTRDMLEAAVELYCVETAVEVLGGDTLADAQTLVDGLV
jgi:hypothetical protein